ncbi:MAG: hypothetical protein H7331_07690, partial [Bacteroidia bacterium]|nr:hypothetical protein [Bacteroidia bacterium]
MLHKSYTLAISLFILTISNVYGSFPAVQSIKIQALNTSPIVAGSVNAMNEITETYNPTLYTDVAVNNAIILGIDVNNPNFIAANATTTVKIKVERWAANNVSLTPTYTTYSLLTVTYNPFSPGASIDKAVENLTGGYKVKVTIEEVNGSSTGALPLNVYVEAQISVERYYNFSLVASNPIPLTSMQKIDTDGDGIYNEIEINWKDLLHSGLSCPAEEYQLEWTFINDYGVDSGVYKNINAINYDFKNNSTRVSIIGKNSYRITNIFEHGYLLCRLRGLGYDATVTPKTPVVGVWSIPDVGSVVSIAANNTLHLDDVHEGNKNWQFSATYAEEGKKKEVINYFDGSLRNRQSVTKVNSDSNVIIGQTIYDHQGRGTINILPVPVKFPTITSTITDPSPAIQYYNKFNTDDSLNVYSRNDFDFDGTTPCVSTVGSMSTTLGASNYYSPNNPKQKAHQGYVPNAEKYPFTQVEYTDDNTGRVKRQSGVGAQHQLGSGHETKYFYGQPNQLQLDRMFGNEVGDYLHYKKNIVVDANGQTSVTYLDQEGRTIATSLAGEAPNSTNNVASAIAAKKRFSVDAFGKNTAKASSTNTINTSNTAIVFNTKLLASSTSYYTFNYDVKVPSLRDSCFNSNVCFDCVYDLQITILDECKQNLAKVNGNTINKHIGKFTLGANGGLVFNTNCADTLLNHAENLDSILLHTGEYTVSKILTVNKAAKDYYVARYMNDSINHCFRPLQSFIDTALANLDTTGCNIGCVECALALRNIGGVQYTDNVLARAAFVAEGLGSELEYDLLLEECEEPCKEQTWCEASYKQLLSDVKPFGQYGKYSTSAQAASAADISLSVFNTSNALPKSLVGENANYQHPKIIINGVEYNQYLDKKGIRTKIQVQPNYTGRGCGYKPDVYNCNNVWLDPTTNTKYTYPEYLANVDDFAANWDENWAKSLVSYHPEYCYYEACRNYSVVQGTDSISSDDFDAKLIKAETFKLAKDLGLLTASGATHNFNIGQDPFVTNSFFQTGIATVNKAPFTFDITTDFAIGKYLNFANGHSMLETAAMGARCATYYGNNLPVNCTAFGTNMFANTTANQVLNDSILDSEWELFRSFYMSEKQKIQQRIGNAYALNTCTGYNGCIGNDKFNAYTEGMIDYGHTYVPNNSGFGSNWVNNYPNSQFFKILQPCNTWTYNYYLTKTKRFFGETDIKNNTIGQSDDLEEMQDQFNYQNYLETGKCPMANDLESLLNALAANGKLNAVAEPLFNHHEFTLKLYNEIKGSATPAPFVPYNWHYADNFGNPQFTFTNSGNPSSAQLINLSGMVNTGITDLSTIVGFSNMHYTYQLVSGNTIHYNFEIRAQLSTPLDTLIASSNYATITGYTTLNINDCNFKSDSVCTANDLAKDITNLMSGLMALDTLTKLNGSIPSVLAPFVTQTLKSNVPYSSSSNLTWAYEASDPANIYFRLGDIAAPNSSINVSFTTFSPATLSTTTLYANGVRAFTGFKLKNTNEFILRGIDITGNVIVTIEGNAHSAGGYADVTLGTCEAPQPSVLNCKGDEFDLRTDLETILNYELSYIRPDLSTNIDLTKSVKYTNLLKAYFPPNLTSTTSKYDKYLVNFNTQYKEQLYFNMNCECAIVLHHKYDSLKAYLSYDNMFKFSNLTPYGATTDNGKQYDFYAIGWFYDNNNNEFQDTIYGESCLPLQLCNPCGNGSAQPCPQVDESDSLYSPEYAEEVDPCVQEKKEIAIANAYKNYEEYIKTVTTDIAGTYSAHCLKSATENMVVTYDDKEYHHTLYYYDQAGNLIRTVPPEGVNLVNTTKSNDAISQQINADRTNNTQNFKTNHGMPTTYVYNSLNQLVQQGLPDHDNIETFDITLPNGLNTSFEASSLQMLDQSNGYMAGKVSVTVGGAPLNRGYLYKTINGAKTWTRVNDLLGADLKKIQMLNPTIGYAIGTNGILIKTQNGGDSWDMLNTYSASGGTTDAITNFNDLYFTTVSSGIMVGAKGKILSTTDGGATFTLSNIVSPNDTSLTLTAITYTGSKYFVSASYKNSTSAPIGKIYSSTLGTSWVLETNPKQVNLTDAWHYSTTKCIVVGGDGTLIKGEYIGGIWVWKTLPTNMTNHFKKVFFADDNNALALVENNTTFIGEIYKTNNAGENWIKISTPTENYTSLYAYNYVPNASGPISLIASGRNGLLNAFVLNSSSVTQTTISPVLTGDVDASTTKEIRSGTNVLLATLVVTASANSIYYSTNGGGWLPLDVTNTSYYTNTVLASGDKVKKIVLNNTSNAANSIINGVILTKNGKLYAITKPLNGTVFKITAISIVSGVTHLFADINSNNGNQVYSFNNTDKKVYYTSLATTNNTAVAISDILGVSLVTAIDVKTGRVTIVGNNGELLTASPISSSGIGTVVTYTQNITPLALNDIQYEATSNSIYAVGNDGTVLQKIATNGWQTLISSTAQKLNQIKLSNATKALIAANNGVLINATLPTTNITMVNTLIATGSNKHIYDIAQTGNQVYIVGENNMVGYSPNITLPTPVFTLANVSSANTFNGVTIKPGTTNAMVVGQNSSMQINIGADNYINKNVFIPAIKHIHFANAMAGTLVAEGNFTLRQTNNASGTWGIVKPAIINTNAIINKVWTVNSNYALAAGNSGYLASISNALATASSPPLGQNLTCIKFNPSNPNTGYIGTNVVAGKVYLYAVNLTPVPNTLPQLFSFATPTPLGNTELLSNGGIRDLHVLDNNNLIVVGENSLLGHYKLGTWASNPFQIPTGSGTPILNAVMFTTSNNGYAAGDNGTLLKLTINNNGTYTYANKSIIDGYNITNSSQANIKAIASVKAPTNMLWAGTYNIANTTNTPYVRQLFEETNQFSTRFWYDRLGRMVVSQNAKQYNNLSKTQRRYSYTLYDALGRITEVGEKTENTNLPFITVFGTSVNYSYNTATIDDVKLNTWINNTTGVRKEITRTFYDAPVADLILPTSTPTLAQTNLRKRVATVTYQTQYNTAPNVYDHATHYTYDIHGNVTTLWQHNQQLYTLAAGNTYLQNQSIIATNYQYDLISGKVNEVHYQNGKPDAFHHHYAYDADNRIKEVYTSKMLNPTWKNNPDDIQWEQDAKYFYYDHGPLARVELGRNSVQGIDYAYNLQGWIKAINSENLNQDNDQGKDGKALTTNANRFFARDAFGYSLGYYNGDYAPIATSTFTANKNNTQLTTASANLYNGNISHMVTTITNPTTGDVLPQATTYKYDQLNRLLQAQAYANMDIANNTWPNTTTYNGRYENTFTYDANGNILTQVRKDDAGIIIDNLSYKYNNGTVTDPSNAITPASTTRKTNNRLYSVNDLLAPNTNTPSGLLAYKNQYADDIDDQGTFNTANIAQGNNYTYDAIGNLISDKQEEIANIEWTVYGKIKYISRMNTSNKPDLEFNYDASGNRICKIEKPRINGTLQPLTAYKYTYYTRDAQGNTMAVYKYENPGTAVFSLTERNLYGSARLGA